MGIGLFTDKFPWYIWLFLSPFMLIGGFMVVALVRQILVAARVPETIVELNHAPACPGESVRIMLSQSGSFNLDKIQVELLCEEKIS